MRISNSDLSSRRSLPSLIAWLSLVMLAAAWGPSLTGSFRSFWMNFGTLGLAAAVGLDVARRIRASQETRRSARVIEQRVMKVLTPLVGRKADATRIRAALQRIAENYHQGVKQRDERRFEPRIPVQMPARLSVADNDIEDGTAIERDGLKVVISEFSSRGIRLLHDSSLKQGTVVVSFDLYDGQTMSLTAQLHWTQRQADGTYASGGTVLDFHPHSLRAGKRFSSVREREVVQFNS